MSDETTAAPDGRQRPEREQPGAAGRHGDARRPAGGVHDQAGAAMTTTTSPTSATSAAAGGSTEPLSLRAALQRTEDAIASLGAPARSWDTGLYPLDVHLGGGLRAGDLALVAGAQGVGKTTATLQIARNVAAAGGRATYVCYEHVPTMLAERLLALEAALVAGDRAPTLEEVRATLSRPADASMVDMLTRHLLLPPRRADAP